MSSQVPYHRERQCVGVRQHDRQLLPRTRLRPRMLQTISKAAGVPAVAAAPAVVDALRHFGARRVSVATPYPDWNNQRLRAYLEASGFEVLNVDGEPRAAKSGNQGINDQDPEDVVAFASRVCRP